MDKLTPEQARQIHDRLGPTVGYLWRLNDLSKGGRHPACCTMNGSTPVGMA